MSEPKEYNFCIRCGRKLRSKENRLRGMGLICYTKYKSARHSRPLFKIKHH